MELRPNFYWLRPKPKAPKPSSPSDVIRFNLIEPPLVMETPELEKEEAPAKPTNILSDKNVTAKDKLEKQENTNELPYAEGKSKIKEVMEKKGSPGQDQLTTPPVKPASKALPEKPEAISPPIASPPKSGEEKRNIEVVSPDEIKPVKETPREEVKKEGEEIDRKEEIARLQKDVIHIPLYNDRLSNARNFGEVTFNAQKHEVAPYIIKMKKKIEKYWAPPVIFTYYGLTSGETVVQFRIMPDGQVKDEDIRVIKEKGDESLKNASVQAIKDSRPFEPIPPQVLAGEKEKYLGITFTFYYIIDKPGEESAEEAFN